MPRPAVQARLVFTGEVFSLELGINTSCSPRKAKLAENKLQGTSIFDRFRDHLAGGAA
jgi:hypothetical protein